MTQSINPSTEAPKVQRIYFHRVGYPLMEETLDIPLGDDPKRHVAEALIHRVLIEPARVNTPTEPSSDTPRPVQPAEGETPREANNPITALSIELLVAAGHVSREKADEAYEIACRVCRDEAERQGTGEMFARLSINAALASPPPEAQAPSEPTPLDDMRARKDAAYLERNRVVAALASAYPSGIARTAIEGWSEDWNGCVYIDLPTGQASWHYHDSHAHLFEHLPSYQKAWDGHTTEEKYERLAALAALPTLPVSEQDKRDADSASPLLAWILDHPETCAEELEDCAKYGMRGSAVFDALQSRRAALKGEAP